MPIRFEVEPRSPLPIYAQLIDQVRRAVVSGALQPGEQLPTVRQLAVDLGINPNTVARVYGELERAGLIATRQGRGTFAAERPPEPSPEERAARIEAILSDAVGEAAALGCTPEALLEAMRRYVAALREKETWTRS